MKLGTGVSDHTSFSLTEKCAQGVLFASEAAASRGSLAKFGFRFDIRHDTALMRPRFRLGHGRTVPIRAVRHGIPWFFTRHGPPCDGPPLRGRLPSGRRSLFVDPHRRVAARDELTSCRHFRLLRFAGVRRGPRSASEGEGDEHKWSFRASGESHDEASESSGNKSNAQMRGSDR